MTKAFTAIEVMVSVAIVLIIAGLVMGCIRDKAYVTNGKPINVIDGCEYFVSGDYNNEILTHKANCTNRLHSWNQ